MLPLIFQASFSTTIQCVNATPAEMYCEVDEKCTLGEMQSVRCTVFPYVSCEGNRTNILEVPCRYCYQLQDFELECETNIYCKPAISTYTGKCKALGRCMGNSVFERLTVCTAHRLSQKVAVLLSLFLGGFAADRFYLGYMISGVFKLLTLGGFGIVYTIDLFLILFGYLGPADGSLFTERV